MVASVGLQKSELLGGEAAGGGEAAVVEAADGRSCWGGGGEADLSVPRRWDPNPNPPTFIPTNQPSGSPALLECQKFQ